MSLRVALFPTPVLLLLLLIIALLPSAALSNVVINYNYKCTDYPPVANVLPNIPSTDYCGKGDPPNDANNTCKSVEGGGCSALSVQIKLFGGLPTVKIEDRNCTVPEFVTCYENSYNVKIADEDVKCRVYTGESGQDTSLETKHFEECLKKNNISHPFSEVIGQTPRVSSGGKSLRSKAAGRKYRAKVGRLAPQKQYYGGPPGNVLPELMRNAETEV